MSKYKQSHFIKNNVTSIFLYLGGFPETIIIKQQMAINIQGVNHQKKFLDGRISFKQGY